MKRPESLLLALVLMTGFALSGCGPEAPPVAQEEETVQVAGIPDSEFEPLAFRFVAPAAKVTDDDDESRPTSVEALISATQGGQLLLDWFAEDADGETGSKVKVEVKVLPGALSEDTIVSISLENPAYAMLEVELEFGTHDTQFLVPAEVKLDVYDLDLSGVASEDEIDFYWYDSATDAWYPVPNDYKIVELDQGKIQGIWYFDHFSRYSLSKGR